MEDRKLSIVKNIKKLWYQEDKDDVYDANDFDELWSMEEPNDNPPSRFIQHSINKDSGINYQRKFKENDVVMNNQMLSAQSEVTVIEPRAFDEALDIVEQLKLRKSVVLNLQYLDSDDSQRVVDFLAGATHALEGHQQRVGQGVFIFAPNNFILNAESNEARALKDAFWTRASRDTETKYEEPMKKNSIF